MASGRVRFVPMSEYRGEDGEGHHVVSLLNGAETTVTAARKFVDRDVCRVGDPVETHAPSFAIDQGVRFMAPNDLVHLGEPASGFTVIGAGKTAVDTCCWLLDAGVAPRRASAGSSPATLWELNRAFIQPLELAWVRRTCSSRRSG